MGQEAHADSAGHRVNLPDPQASRSHGTRHGHEGAHPHPHLGTSVRPNLLLSSYFPLTTPLDCSLTEFGISLSPVPKTINGRILPPPTIEYLDPRRPPPNAPPQTVAVQPSQGAWQMRFARGEFDQKFMKGADIASLAIIVSDQRDVQAITNFLTIGNCNKLGAYPPLSFRSRY